MWWKFLYFSLFSIFHVLFAKVMAFRISFVYMAKKCVCTVCMSRWALIKYDWQIITVLTKPTDIHHWHILWLIILLSVASDESYEAATEPPLLAWVRTQLEVLKCDPAHQTVCPDRKSPRRCDVIQMVSLSCGCSQQDERWHSLSGFPLMFF